LFRLFGILGLPTSLGGFHQVKRNGRDASVRTVSRWFGLRRNQHRHRCRILANKKRRGLLHRHQRCWRGCRWHERLRWGWNCHYLRCGRKLRGWREKGRKGMEQLFCFGRLVRPVIFPQQSQITVLRFLPHLVIRETSHEEKGDSKCFEEKTPRADVNQQRHLTHKRPKGFQFVTAHSLPHVPGHPSPTAL